MIASATAQGYSSQNGYRAIEIQTKTCHVERLQIWLTRWVVTVGPVPLVEWTSPNQDAQPVLPTLGVLDNPRDDHELIFNPSIAVTEYTWSEWMRWSLLLNKSTEPKELPQCLWIQLFLTCRSQSQISMLLQPALCWPELVLRAYRPPGLLWNSAAGVSFCSQEWPPWFCMVLRWKALQRNHIGPQCAAVLAPSPQALLPSRASLPQRSSWDWSLEIIGHRPDIFHKDILLG